MTWGLKVLRAHVSNIGTKSLIFGTVKDILYMKTIWKFLLFQWPSFVLASYQHAHKTNAWAEQTRFPTKSLVWTVPATGRELVECVACSLASEVQLNKLVQFNSLKTTWNWCFDKKKHNRQLVRVSVSKQTFYVFLLSFHTKTHSLGPFALLDQL